MYGKCRWTQTVLSVIIIVLAIWPSIIGVVASKWVIVVAAALILIHSCSCKACAVCGPEMMEKPAKKKKKKKRR